MRSGLVVHAKLFQGFQKPNREWVRASDWNFPVAASVLVQITDSSW